MTYPIAAGTITSNYGPGIPNSATQGAAPPYPSPGASANVAQTAGTVPAYNLAHVSSSTMEELNSIGENVSQQGLPAISNVASIQIAGIPQGQLAVFRWS